MAPTHLLSWLDDPLWQAWIGSLGFFILLTFLVACPLYWLRLDARFALRRTFIIVLLSWGVLQFKWSGSLGLDILNQFALVCLGLALVRLWGMLLVRLLLPTLRIFLPRILEDILIALGWITWGLVLLRLAGLDLSQIVTTSAIMTAVLALAMQDTLGNVLAGLSLQLDHSINLGDWIQLNDINGKVVEMNWRATTIETRNWETIVIPNSILMKQPFHIMGKRSTQQSKAWRRWIWFTISWDTLPTQIITVVEQALSSTQLPAVADNPSPQCILMAFENGVNKYAVRYWLTDIAQDDMTDSIVRTHIDAALRRHNLHLASPNYKILTTKENEKHLQARIRHHLEERIVALKKVDLLQELSEEELSIMAEQLTFTPYVSGDIIMQQGSIAHSLFILLSGEVDVWVEQADGSRHLVDRLTAGHFFGEMGLMVGAAHSTTIIARSHVECLRLEKEAFQSILSSRKELADTMSDILQQRLAKRQHTLQDALGSETQALPQYTELAAKIRHFFGLG